MLLYRYGPIAWFWRVLSLLGLGAAGLFVFLSLRLGSWTLVAVALPLGLPSALLPLMLAIRVERVTDDEILVTNLFFARRKVARASLGQPRLRETAQGAVSHIPAPRAWIPVRGALPIYLDLFAEIPDPAALRKFFDLPRR